MDAIFVFFFNHKQAKLATLSKKTKTPRLGGAHFVFIEVPSAQISNELLEDIRKVDDLYDYFKLTGA